MPFIDPSEDFQHYNGAEAFVEDIPMADGTSKRYLKLRLHTIVIKPEEQTPSCTQWVFIPVDDLDQVSAQLAASAESARRWVPGKEFQTVGENIGVHNTTGKYD